MRLVCVSVAVIGFCAALLMGAPGAEARPDAKKVESGKTQVVAKAGGHEITLNQLRAEMARLRLSPGDPHAERIALESVINRTLLAAAARKAELHRRPEAMAQMHAAQDQALADLYLGVAAQPAEPTRRDIEAYIEKNPALFSNRRHYEFSVLSLATADFDEEKLTPLFDEEKDFRQLEASLGKSGIVFTVNGSSQPSSAFPAQIRQQLSRYGVGDNIVLQGDAQTQIMKIMRARAASVPSGDWPVLARRMLLEEQSAKRAQGLLTRLKEEGRISYYRKSAAPTSLEGEKSAKADHK